MQILTDGWRTNWELFVQTVCARLDRGRNAAEITSEFAGQPVRWRGEIMEVQVDPLCPGVAMLMPRVEANLLDGRRVAVDYLFLHLKSKDLGLWTSLETGSCVDFSTSISREMTPLPSIRWEDLGSPSGTIIFRTEGGALITGEDNGTGGLCLRVKGVITH